MHKTADAREDKSDGPLKDGQSTKFRRNKKWTHLVSPLSKPGGEFTRGRAYVERWSLPPPVSTVGVKSKPAGDLVSAIAVEVVEKSEDEMDDVELMEAILGKAA